MTPVQRVEENRRSLELRNGRIPRIFRNNLAYEDDTNSQFACILCNFGLEHSFVHLQTAGSDNPADIAGVRCCQRPSVPRARNVRTGQQKLYRQRVKYDIDS